MGKREQIDLAPYRQPAAEAYADDVVDPNGKGVMTPDYVNALLREAYLAGVNSIAPEGTTARWHYTVHPGAGSRYPTGSYRQRARAVNIAQEVNNHRIRSGRSFPADARPLRSFVVEGEWEEL